MEAAPPTARTVTEVWVWIQICGGKIADLNRLLGDTLDPRSVEGWTEARKLSPAFLDTILLHDPWRTAIPRQGVRIAGAWFVEPVDLEEADIAHELWLNRSRFTADVNFRGLRTRSLMSLNGSVIAGTLDMSGADVGEDLLMHGGAKFADVILHGARIGAQFNMDSAKVTGKLNMDSANIGGDLYMRWAEFAMVIGHGAQTGGQIDMDGAKITDTLNVVGASIGGDLFMSEGAEFEEVILRGVHIRGQLVLTGAWISVAPRSGACSI
jgi:hypothetical protein